MFGFGVKVSLRNTFDFSRKIIAKVKNIKERKTKFS